MSKLVTPFLIRFGWCYMSWPVDEGTPNLGRVGFVSYLS